uniref:Ig-like domain-containing protein n=1 Tax=Salmo trutta TaxID=8032 RepID=A0A674A911_SALTR
RFWFFLTLFLCAVSSSQDGISAAEVELRVRPGDNITLYCDCTITTGVYIMWYRNCSHTYQPPLVISAKDLIYNRLPGYNVVWNPSNNSYDLLIENITESDLGLYYCGTVENKVVDDGGKGGIKQKELYLYGNISTRISLGKNSYYSVFIFCLYLWYY